MQVISSSISKRTFLVPRSAEQLTRSTSLLSTVEKDARWDSVLAAAWLCSDSAAGELEILFWVSWPGEGHTDEVPPSITVQVNGHLEKKGTLFFRNWSLFSLGMNTTNLPICLLPGSC